jgi:hypothetical protein
MTVLELLATAARTRLIPAHLRRVPPNRATRRKLEHVRILNARASRFVFGFEQLANQAGNRANHLNVRLRRAAFDLLDAVRVRILKIFNISSLHTRLPNLLQVQCVRKDHHAQTAFVLVFGINQSLESLAIKPERPSETVHPSFGLFWAAIATWRERFVPSGRQGDTVKVPEHQPDDFVRGFFVLADRLFGQRSLQPFGRIDRFGQANNPVQKSIQPDQVERFAVLVRLQDRLEFVNFIARHGLQQVGHAQTLTRVLPVKSCCIKPFFCVLTRSS